jgi:hypothetical protein
MFLRNVASNKTHTASIPRRRPSSQSPPSKHQILHSPGTNCVSISRTLQSLLVSALIRQSLLSLSNDLFSNISYLGSYRCTAYKTPASPLPVLVLCPLLRVTCQYPRKSVSVTADMCFNKPVSNEVRCWLLFETLYYCSL